MQTLSRTINQRQCASGARISRAAGISQPSLLKLLARPVIAPLQSTSNGNGNGNGVTSSVEDDGVHASADYCSIDSAGKRVVKKTIGEMEQEYLQALGAWFYDGRPIMSDEEFELLKEELIWNGSRVPILSSDEQRFLEASIAYYKGQPILTDEEYDALKQELRTSSSIVAAEGPRCSIRSRKMYSDAAPDYLRMTLLNLPAAILVLSAIFTVDVLSGFDITAAIELPPPLGIGLLWGVLLPVVYVLSTSITNIVLRDGIILRAQCPSCGTDNFTYFGDIFTVSGNRGQNVVECSNCKADLTFDYGKRIVVVAETPEVKAEKLAAAAAKKAAAAAKKAAMAAKKAAKTAVKAE